MSVSSIEKAAEQLQDVLCAQFMLDAAPLGDVETFDAQHLAYGARLSLSYPGGSIEVGLYGTKDDCHELAKFVLGMDDDEIPTPEEVVDFFGEVINMLAGMLKREEHQSRKVELQIGVPLVLVDDDCAKLKTYAIPVLRQVFCEKNLGAKFELSFCTRDAIALAQEICAILAKFGVDNKIELGEVLSLLGELEESYAEHVDDSFQSATEVCGEALTEIINETSAAPEHALQVIADTMAEIIDAFSHGEVQKAIHVPSFSKNAPPLVHLKRDDESVELYADFIEESQDNLERADGMLLQMGPSQDHTEEIHGLFRTYHSIKGVASFLHLTHITELAHETEHLLASLRDGKVSLSVELIDLLLESTALLQVQLDDLSHALQEECELESYPQQSGLLYRLAQACEGKIVANQGPQIQSVQAPNEKKSPLKATVKVEEALLDALFEKSQILGEKLGRMTPDSLSEISALQRELHGIVLTMRMAELTPLFQKMSRMVRDISKKTEKLTKLTIQGADTKISRRILEGIGEPLVHMIRNAIDHGIESPEQRKRAHKPILGNIMLCGYHDENQVVIEIRDDGKGLNRNALRESAVKKGIIHEDAELSDAETMALIFAPGFSTAAQVTAISGRGVGMDVVKRNIENLGGIIEIESDLGEGTSFRLKLPLIAS